MSTATARARIAAKEFRSVAWVPWSLAAVEILALELALSLGLLVRWLAAPLLRVPIGPDQYVGIAAGILALPIVHYQLGLYPGYCLGPVERLRRRILATLAVFGAMVAFDNIVQRGEWSRGVLLSTFVLALFLPPLAEAAMRWWLTRTNRWGIPVLILGASDTGASIARTLTAEQQLGLVPIGFLDDASARWNTFVENIPVLGPVRLASEFTGRAEAAIVALPELAPRELGALLNELNFPRVLVIPNFTGDLQLEVAVDYTDDFNAPQTITKTLIVTVLEPIPVGPDDGGGGGPVEPPVTAPESLWDKLMRVIRGLLGLDSGQPVDGGTVTPGDGKPVDGGDGGNGSGGGIAPTPVPVGPGKG